MPSCTAATLAGTQPAALSGEPSGASNTANTRARCFGESPESAESKAEMAVRVASEGREVCVCVAFIVHSILARSASEVKQNRRILLCNIILVMRRWFARAAPTRAIAPDYAPCHFAGGERGNSTWHNFQMRFGNAGGAFAQMRPAKNGTNIPSLLEASTHFQASPSGLAVRATSRRGKPKVKTETVTTATALLTAGISDPRERAEALAAFKATADRRDRMLTTAAAATLAGVHRKTLFQWERKGYLKPRRITPSRVRWSRNELENFLCETAGA